ncbi:hypothetical protein L1987_21685 [Smallanthus sonchifolius]|uniref:Uncharacterized protein n=1 Tax=Smallanthus sonchifolius TaxID=185202 RepID=A0ACB9ICT3_9ASTR|nr:hypothetical protein L1987_21685 [Smallanthus sonchifolius]
MMARCIGINQPPCSYGGDRGVDGLLSALDNLNVKKDKLDTIFEELRVVIVGNGNVHENPEGGYYGAFQHPIMSKVGGIDHNQVDSGKCEIKGGGEEIYGCGESKQLIIRNFLL